MGGDRLVGEVAGADVERRHGEEVRAGWEEEFAPVLAEVPPLAGASELLAAIPGRNGHHHRRHVLSWRSGRAAVVRWSGS